MLRRGGSVPDEAVREHLLFFYEGPFSQFHRSGFDDRFYKYIKINTNHPNQAFSIFCVVFVVTPWFVKHSTWFGEQYYIVIVSFNRWSLKAVYLNPCERPRGLVRVRGYRA